MRTTLIGAGGPDTGIVEPIVTSVPRPPHFCTKTAGVALCNWRRPRYRDMAAGIWTCAYRKMPRMAAADTMRKLIEQAGLSQREAANEIGVTQRTFRDWCAGKREPPRAVLMALELLAIKRRNQLLAGKRKTQVRTDGPFTIYEVTDETLGKPDLRGYVIEGPGSDSGLLSAEQVGPGLEELKAKLGC